MTRDRRVLGQVFVGEKNANMEVVRAGLAWHFKRYSKDEDFAKAEVDAKNAKRGLWKDGKAIAPWNWRKRK